MPIVRMAHNHSAEFPEGAYCPVFGYDYNNFKDEDLETRTNRALVLYSTHHGLCLYERGMNGYHDSDFYMTVWVPEKGCTEEICFASTRGWTYPCYASHADATPEVQLAYESFLRATQRRNRILAKWELRRRLRIEREKAGLTREEYAKLRSIYPPVPFQACLELLTANLRSDFKKSLAKHLREWLADPAPKYNTPFSHKQLDCIAPDY